ncbi:carbohydrate-binding domain-containing protein [Serinicoccus profundi]|uniref:carbohydrate-binding domain-containing protein n=1 Tax=Serinicoccus profundi TaxID=1078471 RepID=UPI000255E577|nr:carbohydrate-binding domain-containing protein [Serinicoccus profundi]
MSTTRTRLRTTAASLAVAALIAGCGVQGTTGSTAAGSTVSTSTSDIEGSTEDSTATTEESAEASEDAGEDTEKAIGTVGLTTHADGDEADYDAASAVSVELADDGGSSSAGSGVEVSSTEEGTDLVTIAEAGTYVLSGTLTDGQVVLDVPEEEDVTVVLDGVEVTSSLGSALLISAAEDATVVLADGSENSLTDPATYAQTEAVVDEETGEEVDAPDAALYSTADLTIAGTGALTVESYGGDGITSKDGLVILSGELTVDAVDDGIRGKDFLSVQGGTLTVTADGDGLTSDNTEEGTGIIAVSGETTEITVAAGDDAVKGENAIDLVGGQLTVTQSLEGLESARILVEGGTTDVTASDDALNAASDTTTPSVEISGGELTLTSEGDGLDSNGTVTMTGGTVVVNGPTMDGNGALDVDGDFLVSGGDLLAVGSAGMLMAPSTAGEQTSLATALSGSATAGSTLTVTDADGEVVAEIEVGRDTASLVLSSADLVAGETYTVSSGSTTLATAIAGEYSLGGRGGPRP